FPKGISYQHQYKTNLEIKGVNDSKFKKFEKHGVFKTEIKYYCQMQIGMSLSKTKYCVFLVMNKNDSKLYAELIEFDKGYTSNIAKKAKRILDNPTLLPPKADDYCYFCDFNDVCRGGEVLKRCRTCDNYQWSDNLCIITNKSCNYGEPTCSGDYKLLKMTGEWK
ncbi:MAG: hypothetical protein DRI84_07665, partial [Bacteroidetes bacterium]